MPSNAQLMERLASGEKLDAGEVQQLSRAMDGYDKLTSIVQNYASLGGNQLNIPATFNEIYSQVLSADTASLPISIPGGYKHLMMMLGGQTNNASYVDGIKAQFNGDTAANYLTQGIEGTGSSVTTGSNGTSSILLCDFGGTSGNASAAAGGAVFIPHYNSVLWKTVYTISGEPQRDASNPGVNINCGFWKSTTGINSILISPVTGTLIKSNSAFSVYGIR